MASTDIFVAKESFTVTLNGESITVNKGQTRVRAGHPILKGREMYFEPLTVQFDVEAATSKPGEQRGAPTAPVATNRPAAPAKSAAPADDKPADDKPSTETKDK